MAANSPAPGRTGRAGRAGRHAGRQGRQSKHGRQGRQGIAGRVAQPPVTPVWVAQPLLSLVDTAFVGLSGDASASASQLAALGPATTFFDGATYLFAFLNVATTNLYSSARAKRGDKSDQSESVVRTASRVATRCGFGIMFFLLAFARPLLALYIGTCTNNSSRLASSGCE